MAEPKISQSTGQRSILSRRTEKLSEGCSFQGCAGCQVCNKRETSKEYRKGKQTITDIKRKKITKTK